MDLVITLVLNLVITLIVYLEIITVTRPQCIFKQKAVFCLKPLSQSDQDVLQWRLVKNVSKIWIVFSLLNINFPHFATDHDQKEEKNLDGDSSPSSSSVQK